MKTITLIMGLVLVLASCKKERCTTCSMSESTTGVTANKTFCGTEKEIADENTRLKNEASQLTIDNPGNYYTGGCE